MEDIGYLGRHVETEDLEAGEVADQAAMAWQLACISDVQGGM